MVCPETLQLDTLGTQISPRKVIFDHFFDFGHFPIEIPILIEKKVHSWEGKVLRAKTKTVLKSVSKMQQLGSMPNLKFLTSGCN